MSKYPDSNLVLAGDFNARCGNLQDISSNDDIDFIFNDDHFNESDDFQEKRKSKDKTIYNFRITLTDMCKTFGVHIVNGRLNMDKEGEFTCAANEECSLVDFVIASKLFPFVSSFEVGQRTESVHFSLEL